MSEYYVEHQGWAHWPKVLIMCRKTGRMENGNVAVQRRRYVPERTCTFEYSEEDDRYHCTECGARLMFKLSTSRYCHRCGARIADGTDERVTAERAERAEVD